MGREVAILWRTGLDRPANSRPEKKSTRRESQRGCVVHTCRRDGVRARTWSWCRLRCRRCSWRHPRSRAPAPFCREGLLHPIPTQHTRHIWTSIKIKTAQNPKNEPVFSFGFFQHNHKIVIFHAEKQSGDDGGTKRAAQRRRGAMEDVYTRGVLTTSRDGRGYSYAVGERAKCVWGAAEREPHRLAAAAIFSRLTV